MEELDIIINNMIEAGESEENIALVIQSYEADNAVEEPAPVKKKKLRNLHQSWRRQIIHWVAQRLKKKLYRFPQFKMFPTR
jgi:hypothetical protein